MLNIIANALQNFDAAAVVVLQSFFIVVQIKREFMSSHYLLLIQLFFSHYQTRSYCYGLPT